MMWTLRGTAFLTLKLKAEYFFTFFQMVFIGVPSHRSHLLIQNSKNIVNINFTTKQVELQVIYRFSVNFLLFLAKCVIILTVDYKV